MVFFLFSCRHHNSDITAHGGCKSQQVECKYEGREQIAFFMIGKGMNCFSIEILGGCLKEQFSLHWNYLCLLQNQYVPPWKCFSKGKNSFLLDTIAQIAFQIYWCGWFNFLMLSNVCTLALSNTIGGKVHILIVFLLHNCTHCRKDIGFEEKPICRNTVQGRYLLSDDNGDHFPFLSFYLACYYPKFVIFSGSVIRRLF